MSEKTKKKFRFNFVDAIIIILIAAILAVGGYFTLYKKDMSSSNKVTIEYVIELKTIKEAFVGKIAVGDNVIETVRSENIGVISNIESETARTTTQNTLTGELKEVLYPEELKDIRLTIRKQVTLDNDTYMLNGVELAVGTHISFRVPNYVGSGYCVKITEVKEAE